MLRCHLFYRTYSLSLLLALALAGSALAQTKKPASDAGLVTLADEVYRNSGAFRQALDQYKLALEANPEHLKANYMAGICYLRTIQKERALPYLMKAYDLDPDYDPGMPIGNDLYPDLLFLIGQAYHFGENFDKAQGYYRQFAAHIKSGKGSRTAKENQAAALKAAERRILECENGRKFRAYPVEVSISPLKALNSDYPDYAPVVSGDESVMVFTSRRPGGPASEVDNDLYNFEDIYITKRINDSTWEDPKLLTGVTTEHHEASVAMAADGNTLVLYKDNNGGDLFVSRRSKDGKWGKPKSIGQNINSSFREASGYISADGKRLYFASDRPGGYGGMDVYLSEALDGETWGVPSNMGPMINTAYDDDSPVFSLDGRYMYFSSKGHQGMGGYDIYRTTFDSTLKAWAPPENMGYPINTADNDLYYIQGNDQGHAYFASARETGTGDMDLYLIRPLNPADSLLVKGPKIKPEDQKLPALNDEKDNELAEADTSQAALANEFAKDLAKKKQDTFVRLRIVAVDKATGRLIDVKIRFEDEAGNAFDGKRSSQGVYLQSLPSDQDRKFMVSAEKKGYLYRNMTVSIKKGEHGERILERRLEMEPIALNKPKVLRNVYFDFDKFTLKQQSQREIKLLEDFMKANPSVVIEVAGHTDFVGGEAYNLKLSQQRANSVVKALISRGIDRSRLRAKGYGKRVPIATNDDEKEGRELNRRTEFEVIGGRF